MDNNTQNNSKYPLRIPPLWLEGKDKRHHGVVTLRAGVSESDIQAVIAALKSYDAKAEVAPTLTSGPNGEYYSALKVTLDVKADKSSPLPVDFKLMQHLSAAGLLSPELQRAVGEDAPAFSRPELLEKEGFLLAGTVALWRESAAQGPSGVAALIPAPVRKGLGSVADKWLDTPDKRYRASILSYMTGDIAGFGVGLANRDKNDLGFGLFSFAGTVLGLNDGRHKGRTEAEKLLAEMKEEFSATHREFGTPALEQPPLTSVADKIADTAERAAFPGFWTMNSIGGGNLLLAGLRQMDPFKIFSGVALTTGQMAVLLKRQKGKQGVVDFEALGEQTGVAQAVQQLRESSVGQAVEAVAEKTGVSRKIHEFEEAFHEDPRKMAGKLFVAHNLNMWLVSLFSWVRGPAEMQEVRQSYGSQESAGIWQGIGGVVVSGVRTLFGAKGPQAMEAPGRFQGQDKAWWDMTREEFAQHCEALKTSGRVTPQEYETFLHDAERYHSRQRLMRGGVFTVLMNAAYTVGNSIIGTSSNHEKVNLGELYADAALALSSLPESGKTVEGTVALDQVVSYLARRPEIWEHAVYEKKSADQIKGELKERIQEAGDALLGVKAAVEKSLASAPLESGVVSL